MSDVDKLQDAEAQRAHLVALANRKGATVEDLGNARKRLLALLERLRKGQPSDAEKKLIPLLQADVKKLAAKQDAARKARDKARSTAERLGQLINRLRHKLARGVVAMEDSVTASALRRDVPAAGGYVDGIFENWSEIAGGPWPLKMSIVAVDPASDGRCADVEPGCLTIPEAVGWAKRRISQGHRPVLYTSLSNVRALFASLAAEGIQRGSYDLWVAHYTFHPHICEPSCGFGMPTTADGTQYADRDGNRNVDLSRIHRAVFSHH